MRTGDAVAMSDEEFEHHQQWSSLGGTVATATGVHARLMVTAGEYFGRGKDEIAHAFRSFANEYEKDVVKPRSAELQKYINERLKK